MLIIITIIIIIIIINLFHLLLINLLTKNRIQFSVSIKWL